MELRWPLQRAESQSSADASQTASWAAVRSWLQLSVGALLLAGLFALLVAIARTPWFQTSLREDYFRLSLVGHVTFSLNVWLLGFTAALWAYSRARLTSPAWSLVGRSGLMLAVAGSVLMGTAAVGGLGMPLMVDYLPVLDHPVFLGGLALFLGGVVFEAGVFLASTARARGPLPLYVRALLVPAVAYLAATLTIVVALASGWEHDWATVAWGAGHLIQSGNSAAMVAAWLLLLRADLPAVSQALIRAVLPLYLLPAAIIPLSYLMPGEYPNGLVGAVTWVAVGVPTVTACVLVAVEGIRRHTVRVAQVYLAISMLLFALGGLASALGLEGDTRVTAHYHGTVGAVTVAFMGLVYGLLPSFAARVRWRGIARVQPALYGLGLLFLIGGLFWASSFGGQRKAYEAFAEQTSFFGPMGMFGAGALFALLGGAAFVWAAGAALLKRPSVAEDRTAGPVSTLRSAWFEHR